MGLMETMSRSLGGDHSGITALLTFLKKSSFSDFYLIFILLIDKYLTENNNFLSQYRFLHLL